MKNSKIPHPGYVSRRAFLKSSAAALALTALPDHSYLYNDRKKRKKMILSFTWMIQILKL